MTTPQKLITTLVTFLIVVAIVAAVIRAPWCIYLVGKLFCTAEADWATCFGVGCFVLGALALCGLAFCLLIIPLYFKVAEKLFDYKEV